MSSETARNAEPSVAVNPGNTQSVVISAFDNTMVNQPYYTSSTGGKTFTVFPVDPVQHGDTTIGWSPLSDPGSTFGALYASRLFPNPANPGTDQIDVLRDNGGGLNPGGVPQSIPGSNYKPAGVTMADDVDQPRIAVQSDGATDRVYVGFNDLSKGRGAGGNGATASIEYSTNANAGMKSSWNPSTKDGNPVTLDRAPVVNQRQDGPGVVVAASPDNKTVYAAFVRWLGPADGKGFAGGGSNDQSAQIVVLKDTAKGGFNFGDLGPKINDPRMGMVGIGVNVLGGANTVTIPNSLDSQGRLITGTPLGHERLGSDVAIAVSPTNPNLVYVAYASVNAAKNPQVQIQMSMDGGNTFSAPLVIKGGGVPFTAALPGLAVAQNGTVGLLDTALVAGGRDLETQFWEFSKNLNKTFMLAAGHPELDLSRFPDASLAPPVGSQPYIGDYQGLIAVGNNFYGTFSASNNPNPRDANRNTFPDAAHVFFQRNLRVILPDGTAGSLPNLDLKNPPPMTTITGLADNAGNPLATTSIDPYFFGAASVPEPSAIVLGMISIGAGLAWSIACRVRRRPLSAAD
jgi:hypothetical protein